MTKDNPHSITTRMGNTHDYLPATGHDFLLPAYDLLTRVVGSLPVYDALVGQAELFSGAQILEIGCGTGSVTVRVKRAEPTADVTATDPDPRALARARHKARDVTGVRFRQVYAQDLPFPDASFDRVLSSMMLHHLDPEVKAAALSEAFRVLRPGGSLHIADVHAEGVSDLLCSSGFQVEQRGSRRLRIFGPVTFYRATRPVSRG